MSYSAEHNLTPDDQIVAADSRRGRLQRITRHSVYSATWNESTSMYSCSSRGSSLYRCCAALLIGINAFSKPVHIVTNLSEEATSPASNTSSSNERSRLLLHESIVVGNGPLRLPHYCVDVCTNARPLTQCYDQLRVESANAIATTSSSSVVHEGAAQCHASSQQQTSTVSTTSDEDTAGAGGGNRCINVATLRSVWRLTAASDDGDADSTDLGDPHFMIPIEESLIGQQSDLYEFV